MIIYFLVGHGDFANPVLVSHYRKYLLEAPTLLPNSIPRIARKENGPRNGIRYVFQISIITAEARPGIQKGMLTFLVKGWSKRERKREKKNASAKNGKVHAS